MKYILLPLLLGTMLLVVSCTIETQEASENQEISEGQETQKEDVECLTDSGCGTGGCSNQVCGPVDTVKGIMTTCEWNAEYECLRITSCSCINNKCAWEETEEYLGCLDNVRQEDIVV